MKTIRLTFQGKDAIYQLTTLCRTLTSLFSLAGHVFVCRSTMVTRKCSLFGGRGGSSGAAGAGALRPRQKGSSQERRNIVRNHRQAGERDAEHFQGRVPRRRCRLAVYLGLTA